MKTILIIDDDRKGVVPLTLRLKAAGYQVLTAHDGHEGLKLALLRRPDLIVMDIYMPQGIGILTAQRLKHYGLANVPIIFVTAGSRELLWPIAEEVQPAGFFEKPFNSKQLLETIGLLVGAACVPETTRPAALAELNA